LALAVQTGKDAQIFQAIAASADGGIPASAHAGSATFAALCDAIRAGKTHG
jgi:dihydrodipicolinate synthase/N-acetylneuraminate lyase